METGRPVCRHSAPTTGMTRRSSSCTSTGSRIGPGAFAADVEDVGALGGQPQAVLHGRVGVETVAAVGKTVGRDVDDAHQQRQLAHRERARAELPVVDAAEVGWGHEQVV